MAPKADEVRTLAPKIDTDADWSEQEMVRGAVAWLSNLCGCSAGRLETHSALTLLTAVLMYIFNTKMLSTPCRNLEGLIQSTIIFAFWVNDEERPFVIRSVQYATHQPLTSIGLVYFACTGRKQTIQVHEQAVIPLRLPRILLHPLTRPCVRLLLLHARDRPRLLLFPALDQSLDRQCEALRTHCL